MTQPSTQFATGKSMFQYYGRFQSAGLVIHGGAGPADPSADKLAEIRSCIEAIALRSFSEWAELELLQATARCLKNLEDEPNFNAGLGSALQMDGIARTSASLMDGTRQCFSGIVSVPYIRHPSQLAAALQHEAARVLTSP